MISSVDASRSVIGISSSLCDGLAPTYPPPIPPRPRPLPLPLPLPLPRPRPLPLPRPRPLPRILLWCPRKCACILIAAFSFSFFSLSRSARIRRILSRRSRSAFISLFRLTFFLAKYCLIHICICSARFSLVFKYIFILTEFIALSKKYSRFVHDFIFALSLSSKVDCLSNLQALNIFSIVESRCDTSLSFSASIWETKFANEAICAQYNRNDSRVFGAASLNVTCIHPTISYFPNFNGMQHNVC